MAHPDAYVGVGLVNSGRAWRKGDIGHSPAANHTGGNGDELCEQGALHMDGTRASELANRLDTRSSAHDMVQALLNRLWQLPVAVAPRVFYNRYKSSLAVDCLLQGSNVPGPGSSSDLESVYIPRRLVRSEPLRMGGRDADGPSKLKGKRSLADTDEEAATSVQNALLQSSRIVLLGGPGSGKTTLLHRLAWMVLEEELTPRYVRKLTIAHQDQATETLVPVLVSLPDLAASDEQLRPYLIQVFADHGFPHAGSFLSQRLSSGQCLLLLDGLDAIDAEDGRAVVEQIEALTEEYGDTNFVLVSSRSVGYRRKLNGFSHFELLPFDEGAIERFVESWFVGQPGRAGDLLAALEVRPGLRSMAGNPLLLSLLAVACERDQARQVRGVTLFDTVVETLIDGRDDQRLRACARRLAYCAQGLGRGHISLQEMFSTLQAARGDITGDGQNMEEVLRQLREETDLLVPVSESAYRFAHRVLQQYLAAEQLLEQEASPELVSRAGEVEWREVIPFVAGLQEDPTDLVRGLLAKGEEVDCQTLFLAARCLQEAERADEDVREAVRVALFEVFERDEPSLWNEAASALAGIEKRSTQEAFTGFLTSEDAGLRVRAARALGCIGEHWGATVLIAALGDDVPDVRRTAAWALGKLGDERAVYSLVKLLGDGDARVRQEAETALGAIGEPARRPLVGALGDRSDRVSARAARALGRLGPSAIPALISALDHERDETRRGAVKALVEIRAEAVEPLVSALKVDSLQVRCGALRALGQIGDQQSLEHIIATLGDPDDVVRGEAAQTLMGVGAGAVPPLIEALIDDSRWVSGGAADLLTELGDPAVDGLFEALRGERRAIRWAAAKVLVGIGASDPTIVTRLRGVVREGSSEVRQAGVRALSQIGNDAAIDVLARAVEAEEPALRREAAEALISLGTEEVVQRLREAFRRGVEPKRIVRIVSRIETRFARDFLQELLHDEDRATRNLAAFALEADEASGLYYYRAWEPNIRVQLLQRGSVTTSMLSGIPQEVRPIVLQRYISSHPQVDLAYDTEMDALHLNAIDRYRKVAECWEKAEQNLNDRGELSAHVYADCVGSLTSALCAILEATVTGAEVHERLHCFVLRVSRVVKGTNLPRDIPLVFLRREELTEGDLDDLKDLFRRIKVFHKTALLVMFVSGDRIAQARQLIDEKLRDVHAYDVVVLGENEIQRVVTAKKPPDALRFSICEQADLTLVSPYSCDEPASRDLFFGREFEIRTATQAVVNNSVAILGGRRIGKTSILHRVNEILRENCSCCYLDCHPIRDYRILFRTLVYRWPSLGSLPPEPVSFHSVVAELADDRLLVFVFDEIDALLRFDMANDELLFKTFRSLSQEGLCRFIFSGERVLSNQLKYGSKSPLFNFCGQRIQLGYLEPRSARRLIREPMRWMNIELRDEERVVDAIIDITSCHPRLVQYICHRLIQQVNQEAVRFITPELVERVADSSEFCEEYLYTVWGDATPLERIVTLALEGRTFTREQVEKSLRTWEIPYSWESLKTALHNLKTCSVLVQENATFRFVAQHFPRIARTSLDIDMEIGSLKRRMGRE